MNLEEYAAKQYVLRAGRGAYTQGRDVQKAAGSL